MQTFTMRRWDQLVYETAGNRYDHDIDCTATYLVSHA